MELLGNYDRPTDLPSNRPTDGHEGLNGSYTPNKENIVTTRKVKMLFTEITRIPQLSSDLIAEI